MGMKHICFRLITEVNSLQCSERSHGERSEYCTGTLVQDNIFPVFVGHKMQIHVDHDIASQNGTYATGYHSRSSSSAVIQILLEKPSNTNEGREQVQPLELLRYFSPRAYC